MDDRDLESLRLILCGWAIVDFLPSSKGTGDYCHMVVERDGVRKTMVFGGTELGGWIHEFHPPSPKSPLPEPRKKRGRR